MSSEKINALLQVMKESSSAEAAEYNRLDALKAKERFIDKYPGKIEELQGYVVNDDSCGPMHLLDGSNWPIPTLYNSANVTVFIDKKQAEQAINETKQKTIKHNHIKSEMEIQETNNNVYCFDENEELFDAIYFNHGYGYNLFVYEKEKNARLWIPNGSAVLVCRESPKSLKERMSPNILLQKMKGVNKRGDWYQHCLSKHRQ